MRIPDYYYADKLTHDDRALKYSRTAQALKSRPAGNFEAFMADVAAAMNSQPDTEIVEGAKLYAKALNKPLGKFESFMAEGEALRNSRPDAEIAEAAKLYSNTKEIKGRDTLLSGLAQDYLRAKNTSGRYDAILANLTRDSEVSCV